MEPIQLDIDYIFDEPEGRRKGLQGVELPVCSCALFVYDARVRPSFWNKGVPADLYLSAVLDGECVESHFMVADDPTPHVISNRTALVIESRVEIPVGSKLEILDFAICEKLVVS